MSEKKRGLWKRLLDIPEEDASPPPELDFSRRQAAYGPQSGQRQPSAAAAAAQMFGPQRPDGDDDDDEGDTVGVEIVELGQGNPLEAAGIQVGDVIVTVNGRPTPNEERLAEAFMSLSPGRPATVVVTRGEQQLFKTLVPPD